MYFAFLCVVRLHSFFIHLFDEFFVKQRCAAGHTVHVWSSQPRLARSGVNAGDFMLATNILLSGNTTTDTLNFFCLFANTKCIRLKKLHSHTRKHGCFEWSLISIFIFVFFFIRLPSNTTHMCNSVPSSYGGEDDNLHAISSVSNSICPLCFEVQIC